MIQSDKFDSSIMNIKNITNSILIFTGRRLVEIWGIFISFSGILLLISFVSYSPNDPNFIFPDNTEINNFLGFQGSYISDLFFQSLGLITYLVCFSFFFTGITIFRNKEIFLFIENTFYVVLYCIIGSVFFDFFYKNTFTLYINGNGGFVGNYLNESFFKAFISPYERISYYFLVTLIIILFSISINFNIKKFLFVVKKFFNLIFNKNSKNYTNKSEIINEYIPQEEIKILSRKIYLL